MTSSLSFVEYGPLQSFGDLPPGSNFDVFLTSIFRLIGNKTKSTVRHILYSNEGGALVGLHKEWMRRVWVKVFHVAHFQHYNMDFAHYQDIVDLLFEDSYFLRVFQEYGKELLISSVKEGGVNGDYLRYWEDKIGSDIPLIDFLWILVARGWKPGEMRSPLVRACEGVGKELYDAAFFKYRYPFLPEPPEIKKTREAYSVSLVWLHETPQKYVEGQLLYPRFKDEMAPCLQKWVILNPGTKVRVYYDSSLVEKAAVENSRVMMREMGVGEDLKFIDWRSMRFLFLSKPSTTRFKRVGICHLASADLSKESLARTYFESLFARTYDLYQRVDMLKALIGIAGCRYQVVVDVDLEPLSREELFCKRTCAILNYSHFIAGECNYGSVSLKKSFENTFTIVDGSDIKFKMKYLQSFVNTVALIKRRKDEEASQAFFCIFYGEALVKVVKQPEGSCLELPLKPVPVPPSKFCA